MLRYAEAISKVPEWLPKAAESNLRALSFQVVNRMRRTLAPHRYKGTLQEGVKYEYSPSELATYIGSTAKRGSYDAGLIMELGTRPIPNAPYRPIKMWALRRGINPYFVWKKIRERGVNAYPFLDDTLLGSERDIRRTGRFLVTQLSVKIANHMDRAGRSESVNVD
jgi:hypothetical protein